MKDQWYGDARDLIKWGGIVHLCRITGINHVMQIAYWRPSESISLVFNGKAIPLPEEVNKHFRDITDIKRLSKTTGLSMEVVTCEFDDRNEYTKSICNQIEKQSHPQIVLLDPDTGLAIRKEKAEHVTTDEIKSIWHSLKKGDVIVLYQHSFRDKHWEKIRQNQLAETCNLRPAMIKKWKARDKPKDVIFFYCEK